MTSFLAQKIEVGIAARTDVDDQRNAAGCGYGIEPPHGEDGAWNQF
jgi:hypothetical protein